MNRDAPRPLLPIPDQPIKFVTTTVAAVSKMTNLIGWSRNRQRRNKAHRG